MSNSISILEGSHAKSASNVARIVTELQSGGVCYWVPEDERLVRTKYVNKNGLYLPSDDSVYGYSKITVNVPGGAAGYDLPTYDENGTEMPSPTSPDYDPDIPTYGPVSIDPTTNPVEIPPIDGGVGSSVVGVNPIDGNEYKAGVNKDGEIEMTLVPSEIRVLKGPSKEPFVDGETIDYHGTQVFMFSKTGEKFTDYEKYPDGYLPLKELSFSPTIASIEEATVKDNEWDVSGTGLAAPVYLTPIVAGLLVWGSVSYTAHINDKICIESVEASSPVYYYAVADDTNIDYTFISKGSAKFTTAYYNKGTGERSGPADTFRLSREATYGEDTIYYTSFNIAPASYVNRSFGDPSVFPVSAAQPLGLLDSAVVALINGHPKHGYRQKATVNWKSVYDGRPMSTTFDVGVSPKPSSGESVGDGEDVGGGGGGHSF